MINHLEVFKEAVQLGSTKTLTECKEIIARQDSTTLIEDEKRKYRVEIWDKNSSINGIPADAIAKDVPNSGEVYLVYENGILSMLQKHDPHQMGFVAMNAEQALQVANGIINEKVNGVVKGIIYNSVLEEMLI